MEATPALNKTARELLRNKLPRTLIHSIDLEVVGPNTARVLLEDTVTSFVYAVGRERAREIAGLLETNITYLDAVAKEQLR